MSAQRDEKKMWSMLDRFFLRVLGEKAGKEVMAESRDQAAAFLAASPETSPSRRETMRTTILPRTAVYTVLKRRGVRLAAATATDRVVAEPALKRLGLWDFFDAFLTCTEEGVDKNTPTLYERAARAAGGNPPGGCAVFEDALHCIRTVKAAGFYTVAVQDDSTAYAWAEICRIADAHIASYIELLEQA